MERRIVIERREKARCSATASFLCAAFKMADAWDKQAGWSNLAMTRSYRPVA